MREAILQISSDGGPVAWVLVVVCFLVWIVAVQRWFALRRGFRGSIRELLIRADRSETLRPWIESHEVVLHFVGAAVSTIRSPGACRHDLARWYRHALDRSEAHGTVLRAMVTAAPLLGLLGTVSGMVETFASLRAAGDTVGRMAEQTVAGGISVALITTQMGLVVGIPGLAIARLLDRLEKRRRDELREALALVSVRLPEEAS